MATVRIFEGRIVNITRHFVLYLLRVENNKHGNGANIWGYV